MRRERHHQIAIVLHPFLFSGDQKVDQIGLDKPGIPLAEQLRHLIERHNAASTRHAHIWPRVAD
jgi:hypothetical protein